MEGKAQKAVENIKRYESYGSMTIATTESEWPLLFVEGKGATIRDMNGKEYIDFTSGGVAITNTGHCHPAVVEAIQQQAQKLIYCSSAVLNPLRAQLLEKIIEIAPSELKRMHFGISGADAIEIAIKLSRAFTKKTEIITFFGGYHGRTFGALALTPFKHMRMGFYPLMPGVISVPFAYCYRCAFGKEYPECNLQCVNYIENLIKSTDTGVTEPAAIILEPIQATRGCIVPPNEFLPELRRICDETGLLLIADEIQTGFGRTGKMFAVENWNVVPDIMAVGKGLASGVPLSAVLTKEEIMKVWKGKPYEHSSTFAGNLLGVAAALATIKVIKDEQLVRRSAELGEYILKSLQDIASRHKLIGEIRGKGLLIGIELVKSDKTPAAEETNELIIRSLRKGVWFSIVGAHPNRNIIKLAPPLVIDKTQVDKSLEVLDEALSEVEKKIGGSFGS